jgi:hypothetical protein
MHSDYISPRNSIVWDRLAESVSGLAGKEENVRPSVDAEKVERDIRKNRTTQSSTREQRLRKEAEGRAAKQQSPVPNQDGIAVIIGNRNYRGRTPAVDFAFNDADAMRRYVIARMGFRPGNIIDLRDTTRAEIATVFGSHDTHKGRLFNWVRAGKSDVVVFYSGHGVPGLRNRRGYLLPVDADPNFAEIGGYPVDLLYENLGKIQAKSISVFLDACFSGDSPRGMLVRATSGISVKPKNPKAKSKFTVLTAASADQFASWDEEAKHGLFTKHLLEALNGAADGKRHGNGDGNVTLGEVKRYLDAEMSYQARRRYGREQVADMQGRAATVLATLASSESDTELSAASSEPDVAVELAFWNTIKDTGDPAMFEAYLRRYPLGAFAELARLKIRSLSSSTTGAP